MEFKTLVLSKISYMPAFITFNNMRFSTVILIFFPEAA